MVLKSAISARNIGSSLSMMTMCTQQSLAQKVQCHVINTSVRGNQQTIL